MLIRQFASVELITRTDARTPTPILTHIYTRTHTRARACILDVMEVWRRQAEGALRELVRQLAGTARLVTEAEARRKLLTVALRDPTFRVLRDALGDRLQLQEAAAGAVVATCNRMAGGPCFSIHFMFSW